jgi:2'-5' RNA ligase
VVWGGVTDGAESLQRLHAALEEEMLELGCYRTEERGYTPHLTLGRVNDAEAGFAVAAELPKRAAWQGGRFAVEEVLVFSSEMDRDGPVYTVMGRAPLAGKPT